VLCELWLCLSALIGVLECRRDSPHVVLDGQRPVLDVTQLFDRFVQCIHQLQPLMHWPLKLSHVLDQLFGLLVQLSLVEVCFGHSVVQMVDQICREIHRTIDGFVSFGLYLFPLELLFGVMSANHWWQHSVHSTQHTIQ